MTVWQRYACPAHKPSKLMFVLIPKAASTSIAKAMLEMNGVPASNVNPGDIHKRRRDIEVPRHTYGDYYVAAFVRNPYERIYSVWRDKISAVGSSRLKRIAGDMGFLDFLRWVKAKGTNVDGHVAPMTDFLVDESDGTLIPDFIGRFETLGRDWETLRSYGFGLPELRRLNVVGSGDYHDAYTDEAKSLIEELYGRDIDLFRYRF